MFADDDCPCVMLNLLSAAPLSAVESAVRPLAFEVRIPTSRTWIEVWFEGRGQTGTTGWDSPYGQNYAFAVAHGRAARGGHLRADSETSNRMSTGGLLHQFEVPANTQVRPIPGGW